MIKNDTDYLGHMLDQARTVARQGSREDTRNSTRMKTCGWRWPTSFRLLEKPQGASPTTPRPASPEVPLRQIMGMHSKIVHDYMNVDEDILWTVVTVHVPALASQLTTLVLPESPLEEGGVDIP